MTSTAPSLRADNIRAGIGIKRPLSFSWDGPGIYGVLGPNGAGKSTLLRLLAGVLPATQGMIKFNDVSLTQGGAQWRSRTLAYLPQEAPLAPLWTVQEVIEQGLTPYRYEAHEHRKARREMEWACECLALTPLLSRRAQSLSGGERRRVLIARAISQNTPFVLLDEPLASLDWSSQEELMRLLSELTTRRQTQVVISLHDLNLAWLFADHALLFSQGELIAQGDLDEAINQEAITQAFGVSPLLISHPYQGRPQHLPRGPL